MLDNYVMPRDDESAPYNRDTRGGSGLTSYRNVRTINEQVVAIQINRTSNLKNNYLGSPSKLPN